MYVKDAFKFILKHNLKIHKNVSEKEIKIGKFTADIFSPPKSRGTILAVHGMSYNGNKDPRMMNLCRSFAGTGFTVIAPSYKKIAGLKIEKGEIKDIISTIKHIAGDKTLCPEGKIGLFSVSFSGGLCLIAASDVSVRNLISSVLVVGSHGDVKSSVEYFMEKAELDDYGTMIVLYNFIEFGTGPKPNLAKSFYLSAIDNSRNTDELTAHLKKLSAKDRDLFLRLKTDPQARMNYWKKILKAAAAKNIYMKDISPYPLIENVDAAVTFIHGDRDPVIPPEQSVIMHEKRINAGKKSKLLLTPILSHGNVSLGLSRISAVIELAKAFAFFFRYLK